jgi:DNA-binding transcriptional MerR regulator
MATDEGPDELIPIGRFARLAGLSIGALRHYDELGILRPADVDRFTAYRRYRREQLETARTIRRLRDLELPIDEIRAVLAADDPADSVVASPTTAGRRPELRSTSGGGEWQCSRVYATLGRGEPAVWHARRCVEYSEAAAAAGEAETWDVPSSYEAMARALAVAGDRAAAEEWRSRARAAVAAIAEPEDRQVIEQDLATLPL